MSKPDYPRHWVFALAGALHDLEELIWHFETIAIDAEERGHSITSVPLPDDLMTIVEGFLSEKEKLLQGDILRLEKMLNTLEKNILPLYRAGEESARQRWAGLSQEEKAQLDSLRSQQFRIEGAEKAPAQATSSERYWFAEGYAVQWNEERFEYLKSTFDE